MKEDETIWESSARDLHTYIHTYIHTCGWTNIYKFFEPIHNYYQEKSCKIESKKGLVIFLIRKRRGNLPRGLVLRVSQGGGETQEIAMQCGDGGGGDGDEDNHGTRNDDGNGNDGE